VDQMQAVSRSSNTTLAPRSTRIPNKDQVITILSASQAQPQVSLSPRQNQSQNNHNRAKNPQPEHQLAAVPARPSKKVTTGSAPSPPPTSTNTCKPPPSTAPALPSWAHTLQLVNSRSSQASSFNLFPHRAKLKSSSTPS
jgi:hypothetical protein